MLSMVFFFKVGWERVCAYATSWLHHITFHRGICQWHEKTLRNANASFFSILREAMETELCFYVIF